MTTSEGYRSYSRAIAPTALALLAAASVTVSLVVRVLHRGPYYPGFDLAGVANGLFLVSTRSPWTAVVDLWTQNRNYGAPFPYYSALGALLPGLLTAAWPWEWWAHVVTFVLVVATVALIARATGVGWSRLWVLLLAWGASPALLSFAVVGFPWASAFLPHALALWIALDARWRRHTLLTLAGCLVASELSWHVYEIGRTAFLVFVVAAVVLRGVPLRIRAIWVLAAALQLWQVLSHPTQHTLAYATADAFRPAALAAGLASVARTFPTGNGDLPLLAAAAVLTVLAPTRGRVLLLLLLAAQLVLLAALAASAPPGARVLWPRRFLLADFYCLALIASLFGEADSTRRRAWLRAAVAGLLVVGNGWQLADLGRFVARGYEPAALGVYTLPYTRSFDYYVQLPSVDWARELTQRVDAGETLFLLYNFGAYDENFTNPEGVLERLYVRLGHRRFVESVFVFGSTPCRHDCLPIRPLEEVGTFLDGLRAGSPVSPAAVTGYVVANHPVFKEALQGEKQTIISEIARRFRIRPQSAEGVKFMRFTLAPRDE